MMIANKEALRGFRVHEDWEAGIVLSGAEVKSVKAGHVQFKGSYIAFEGMKPVVRGLRIAPYPPAQGMSHVDDPTRDRELLLHRREREGLLVHQKRRGLTILPLKLYTKGGLIKVNIGLVSSKSKADKRSQIRERELAREVKRAIKSSHGDV